MEAIETINGQFTQAGPVTEVKPSADEEVRMMRQMTFLPEGLRNPSLIMVNQDEAAGIVLDVRMWVEVRKSGEVWFCEGFGYELNVIND